MFQIPKEWEFYAFCPACNSSDKQPDFIVQGKSLSDAREQLEVHEKECHKGKPVGTFGQRNMRYIPYKKWETYFRQLTEDGMDCVTAWHVTNKHFGMPYDKTRVGDK